MGGNEAKLADTVQISEKNLKSFLEASEKLGLHKRFKYLITTVGYSPEPPILFIRALQREDNLKKVFFIVTSESEHQIDVILNSTGITSASKYDKEIFAKTAVADIYRYIKELAAQYDPREILVDITGGTKGMAGAAALAAAMCNLQMAYADYVAYDPLKRRPREECEQEPVLLDNPLKIYGVLEVLRAKDYIEAGRYYLAFETLKDLEGRLEDLPLGTIRALARLAKAYHMWSQFRFDEARQLLEECVRDKHIMEPEVGVDVEQVEENLGALEKVCEGETEWILANLYNLALSHYKAAQYDVAVLVIYRCFEHLWTSLLKGAGIDPSDVDWDRIPAEAQRRFDAICRSMRDEPHRLRKIGFMDQLRLLVALGLYDAAQRELGRFKHFVLHRNQSILAHGLNPVDRETAEKQLNFLKGILVKHFKSLNKNFHDVLRAFGSPWRSDNQR